MSQMNSDIQGLPGIVTALQKGGVTKTSLGLNVAERLASRGHDVVMIDLDHDCHLTSLLLDDDTEEEVLNSETHIGKAMFGDVPPSELIIETDFGVDLIPSTNLMGEVVRRMQTTRLGINRIRNNIVAPLYNGGDTSSSGDAGYDYFIIDPPGGEGQMLDAAFVAVQRTIIPITPEAGTVNGLARLLEPTIRPRQSDVDMSIDVVAITPNRMYESISRESSEQAIIQNLNETFRQYLPSYAKVNQDTLDAINTPGETLSTIPKPGIRERKAINDAFKSGLPVAEYNEDCDQIQHFDELAQMVIDSCNPEAADREEKVIANG